MENKEQKEIEIVPFMVNRTNTVNTSQRDQLYNDILAKVELEARKEKNNLEKREIFYEQNNRDRHFNNKKSNLNIRNISKLAITTLGVVGLVVLCKTSSYENKPIKLTVYEMAADSGLALTDNGKKFSGTMTQEELVNYAIENNLTIEQIEEEITKFSKRELLNEEFTREKMEEENPEIFKRL